MTGNYKAYLLRFQRGSGQERWRATIIDALCGEKKHFATERDLFRYLMLTLAEEPPIKGASAEASHGVDTFDEDRCSQD